MKRIAPGAPEGISGKTAHVCLLKNRFAQNRQMNCLRPPSLLVQAALRLPVERHYGKSSAKIKVLFDKRGRLPVVQSCGSPAHV